jgi:hypothetical protein
MRPFNTGFQRRQDSVILGPAPWWWWKARPFDIVTETTMIIIGIVLSFVGLGLLCWLLFTLAVYALPFAAGVTVGLAAYQTGSGPIGAILVGLIVGVVTLVTGQIVSAAVRSPVHGEFVNYAAIGIWNRPRQWYRQA